MAAHAWGGQLPSRSPLGLTRSSTKGMATAAQARRPDPARAATRRGRAAGAAAGRDPWRIEEAPRTASGAVHSAAAITERRAKRELGAGALRTRRLGLAVMRKGSRAVRTRPGAPLLC